MSSLILYLFNITYNYTDIALTVNVSRMSPKLVRTSPHILENRGITMAPLFLILIS